ncbi:Probable ABC transporter permease protein HI_1471 [Yokenella regensburgei]|nr:Probable ABC transporter permease protein HI_1471 [Yokenella regensburgei]
MSAVFSRQLWSLLALLLILALAATSVGALKLPLSLLWQDDSALRQIWFTIRLPRVLLALVVGGSLALAGCVMQGLFRNPLADPGLLGISSGAALAVALWVVLPFTLPAIVMLYAPMLAAFMGSLAVTAVIFVLSQRPENGLSRLLLVGIAINALCGAAVGVLSWLSNDAQLRQLSLWGMGSLGQAQWSTLLAVSSLMLPSVWIIWRLAQALNLLQLGEEDAHYLGVDVKTVQRTLLLFSALLVAAAVAVSGVIGFVGLVVPPPAAPVAGCRSSGGNPGFCARRRDTIAGGRHAGAYPGRPCRNAGRAVNQPARRAVVFVDDFSSWRGSWIADLSRHICAIGPVNVN